MSDKPAFIKDFGGDLMAWLVTKAHEGAYSYLLAHADDGVIWGRFADGKLYLAGEVFPELQVALRPETLQQARLFGKEGELFVWRTDEGFDMRQVQDRDYAEHIPDEQYRLWGEAKGSQDGFRLMVEGKEGLRHAVPAEIAKDKRAVLRVRHYIDYIDNQAVIVDSRLVDVEQGKEE